MDGFITESVGKISSGFGNAIKLLMLYGIFKFILLPIQGSFHRAGEFVVIFILLALAAFYLYRSHTQQVSDQVRTWKGMASGVFFWLAFLQVSQLGAFPMFNQIGVIFWLMLGLFSFVLWKHVLPIGVKMGLLVFLTCWAGKIYFYNLDFVTSIFPAMDLMYQAVRYLAILAGVVAVFYIIYRSKYSTDRSYAAVVIFNAILFLLSGF